MGNKIWENVIIFVLLGIVVIFLTPVIQGIFFRSQLSGSTTSTQTVVRAVEVLYEKTSLEREVVLPFIVEFKDNEKYDVYENIKKIAADQFLDTRGTKPTGGKVVIDKDGSVYAKGIKYGSIVCDMEKNRTVTCARQ